MACSRLGDRICFLVCVALLCCSSVGRAVATERDIDDVCSKAFKVTPLGYRCSTPITVSTDEEALFRFKVEGTVDSSVYIATLFQHGNHSLDVVLPDGSSAEVKTTATDSTAMLDYSTLKPGEYTIRISALSPVSSVVLWVQVFPNGNHPYMHPRDRKHMESFYKACCVDNERKHLTSKPCQLLHDTVAIEKPTRSLCQSPPNTCDLNGHITSLRLTHGGEGAFSCREPPKALGLLQKLRQLDLSANKLQWDMSSIVNVWDIGMQNEQTVLRLHMAENELTGRLNCKMLTLFPKLESLRLEVNKVRGDLPACFLSSTTLKEIDISDNQLQGPIPAIADGSHLRWIGLADNSFTGELPPTVVNAHGLSFLDVSNNELTGEVPKMPSNLTALVLNKNRLASIPQGSLAGLDSLMKLDVSNNQLQGPLPEDLLKLPAVAALYLSSNQLGGPLDQEWQTRNLRVLHADHNEFTGFLPKALASGKVCDLQLHHNMLNGPLSRFISAVKVSNQLLQLNASFNQLEGQLPFELQELAATKPNDIMTLGALGKQHVLDLSHNKLKDAFPDWLLDRIAEATWKPSMQIVLSDPALSEEADNTIYCPVTTSLDNAKLVSIASMYSASCVLPQNATEVPLVQALSAASRGELLPGPPDLMTVYAPVPVEARLSSGSNRGASPAPSKSSHGISKVGIALVGVSVLLVLLIVLDIFVLKVHRKLLPKGSCRKVNMAEFPEEVGSPSAADSQRLQMLGKDTIRSSPALVTTTDAEIGLARTRVAG